MLEELAQRLLGNALHRQRLERLGQRRVADQLDQLARQPRLVGMLDQIVAHLRGFIDPARAASTASTSPYSWISLRGGLGADAGDAGDVVDAVAHQRQHVAELARAARRTSRSPRRGRSAGRSSCRACRRPGSISCIRSLSEETMVTCQPCVERRLGIAGDDVVGLEPVLLDAGDGEGAGGVADQRELRHQLGRRRRPVRLVLVVHLVAERALARRRG